MRSRNMLIAFAVLSSGAFGQPATWGAGADNGTTIDQAKPAAPVVVRSAEVTLQGLHASLSLNAEQQRLWLELEARAQAWEKNLFREPPVQSVEPQVVAQMGRLTQNLENRLVLLEDLQSAIKNLYVSLKPEQQAVLNASLLQSIPGVLPSMPREPMGDAPGVRRESWRSGAGTGRRRSGGMGGLGGLN